MNLQRNAKRQFAVVLQALSILLACTAACVGMFHLRFNVSDVTEIILSIVADVGAVLGFFLYRRNRAPVEPSNEDYGVNGAAYDHGTEDEIDDLIAVRITTIVALVVVALGFVGLSVASKHFHAHGSAGVVFGTVGGLCLMLLGALIWRFPRSLF